MVALKLKAEKEAERAERKKMRDLFQAMFNKLKLRYDTAWTDAIAQLQARASFHLILSHNDIPTYAPRCCPNSQSILTSRRTTI